MVNLREALIWFFPNRGHMCVCQFLKSLSEGSCLSYKLYVHHITLWPVWHAAQGWLGLSQLIFSTIHYDDYSRCLNELMITCSSLDITKTIHPLQVQIQDFEMGGEFSPPQSEKSEKSNIISIFEGQEKKKRKKGAQKKEGENSPISPPLDPCLLCCFSTLP